MEKWITRKNPIVPRCFHLPGFVEIMGNPGDKPWIPLIFAYFQKKIKVYVELAVSKQHEERWGCSPQDLRKPQRVWRKLTYIPYFYARLKGFRVEGPRRPLLRNASTYPRHPQRRNPQNGDDGKQMKSGKRKTDAQLFPELSTVRRESLGTLFSRRGERRK